MAEMKDANLAGKIPLPTDNKSRPRIIVVDDDKFYLRLFSDLITEAGYESLAVQSGFEALEKMPDYKPDVVITDVMMPGMDGFELTKRIKTDPIAMHTPVLMVTTLADISSKVKGLASGADELITKPVDETEFKVRIRNLIRIKKYDDFLIAHGRELEGEVQSKTVQLEKALEKIRRGYIETEYRLALAAEYRDKETGNHIKRISLYSQLIARFLGLSEPAVEAIFFASPMHDIGKIGIPDAVLLKQGWHTNDETTVMRQHTVIGASILHEPDSEILKTAEEVALTHHEDWNGSGYPRGLKGEEIPLSGRIVHLVDIYDALRSKRPYKNELDHKTACEIIEKEMYRFDPQIYKAFVACADNLNRLFNAYGEANDLLNLKRYGSFPVITKRPQ